MNDNRLSQFVAIMMFVAACYAAGWLYALARAPRDERVEVARSVAGYLFNLLVGAAMMSFFIAFIVSLILFPLYERRTEAIPFASIWLVSFVLTVAASHLYFRQRS